MFFPDKDWVYFDQRQRRGFVSPSFSDVSPTPTLSLPNYNEVIMYDSKSGLQFLRRNGIVPALFFPLPRIEPAAHGVHQYSLEGVTPPADYVAPFEGEPPPDRYQALAFPPPLP